MSRFGTNNYGLLGMLAVVGLFGLAAESVQAADLEFQDETYSLTTQLAAAAADPGLRLGNLEERTRQLLLDDRSDAVHPLWDQTTLDRIVALAEKVNQPAINAELALAQDQVVRFHPGQSGYALDLWRLDTLLLTSPTKPVPLPVHVFEPAMTLAQTNDLGIVELVSRGESDFAGSPNNRIHNIKVGAAKFQWLLLPPGEEFSFNDYLGDVDAEHGFLPELVIKKDGLIPEFGGGLCQVSSTAFRAAMNAGLPITERRNHSFAVRYYAPQGTDATIYPGVVDLKFINDLSSHLLVATKIEGTRVFFDFYGAKDDRTVTFDGPYQYDQQTDGSMKAVWTRTVTRGEEARDQVFRSTYLPPELFTKKEEPSTPNPTAPDDQAIEDPQPL